ncbi:MAG: glycosyltransferase family 4 protein [Sulfitobacter sp.]|nr:glycosyltransferase family 4 protein [Sulfitobacter sp.]
MSDGLAINGRFHQLEPGGFRTYAVEVAKRLPGEVLIPPKSMSRGFRGRWWEGFVLPRLARDRTLLNLTGSAPTGRGRQVTVIHDVLPLLLPGCYASAYVKLFRRQVRRVIDSASALVVPSAQVRTHLVHGFGADPESTWVAPPGLHRPVPNPDAAGGLSLVLGELGISPDLPLVVGFNSSIPRKNGAQTLAVLEGVSAARRDVAVVAVGADGPVRVFGRSSRPQSSIVPDLGTIDGSLFDALLVRANVVVSMSLGEGFGLVPLEAAVRGSAVVSTPVPSLDHLSQNCTVVQSAADATTAVLDLVGTPPVDYSHLHHRLSWHGTAELVQRAVHSVNAADHPARDSMGGHCAPVGLLAIDGVSGKSKGRSDPWHA